MRKTKLAILTVAVSLMMTGMAFALDITNISTWTQSMGVGGGGPGLGDLLLAPLYDVRNLINPNTPEGSTIHSTQQTLIGIVNTDNSFGVVARIRFREWKRSEEVLDFDIPLSCNDVWVGEISRNTNGGALIKSPDFWINAAPSTDGFFFFSGPFPSGGIAFKTDAISEGTASDKLARTEYGYIELIGEERVSCKRSPDGTWARDDQCIKDAQSNIWCAPNFSDKTADVQDKLMANAYLIRPEVAISHEYNWNAFSDFSVKFTGIWEPPTTGRPNLQASVQGAPGQPGIGGFDQLEAIMSKRFVDFQYVTGIDPVTNTPMSTSAVITLPTKHFHYGPDFHHVAAWAPFTGYHETPDDGTNGGEVIDSSVFDRDEHLLVPPQVPVSPGTTTIEILPWEVNVIGMLNQDPLPSPFARGFRDNVLIATKNSTGQEFLAGWAEIDLSPNSFGAGTDPRSTTYQLGPPFGPGVTQGRSGIQFSFFNNFFGAPTPPPVGQVAANCGTPPGFIACPGAYRGLPAIGIVMTEFFNDSVNGYYGNTVPWQYEVDWGDPPASIP